MTIYALIHRIGVKPVLLLAAFLLSIHFASIYAAHAAQPDMPGGNVSVAEGPHGGKLMVDGNISVELAIFEDGVPPEYRAWVMRDGVPLTSDDSHLTVKLDRLGGRIDRFTFRYQGDYWSASGVVGEPHSFDVGVTLAVADDVHNWVFPSYEGRTRIAAEIAAQAGIKSTTAGAVEIHDSVTVYGRTVADAGSISHLRARFPGAITRVVATIGDRVAAGDVLAEVESNESLKRYAVKAPFDGVITDRHATAGEQAAEQALFTLANYDQVWAEFQVFPSQIPQVRAGQAVTVSTESQRLATTIEHVIPRSNGQPFLTARVRLDNRDGSWPPGLLLEGKVTASRVRVPLAVDNNALQSFRGGPAVFIQLGDDYQIRPLKIGRGDKHFSEVLEGLTADDRYVVDNSYLVKADVEKSGASHDH